MPLPETIPVKYTEEEAEYVSIRPVVRQTFRGAELIDMVLGVTGKDLPRIQQILRSGTIVFHSYRYWWPGFEADSPALAEVLAGYPDSDPARLFRAEACTEVILESSGSPARHSLRLRREETDKKRFLRARSFWDCLMDLARGKQPAYREYSYALRGDIYFVPLSPENIAQLASHAAHFAPRSLRARLATLASASQLVFICPRH